MKRILIIALLVIMALLPLAAQAPTPASAQSGNIWTAWYWNNPDWAGNPVLSQQVPLVWFNWGTGSPGANVPVDNFTARFDTNAFFYAGTYRFTITADDEFALLVNNVTFLDTRGAGRSGKTMVVDVPFVQGNSNVSVLYREFTGAAYITVTWQYIKGDTGSPPPPPPPPPSNTCSPPSASSVQTQFGDYTPCIQQNIHQVNCFQSNGAWNAPNQGSIQMEPQITIWGNCVADTTTSFPVSCDPNVPMVPFNCSKTEAGWFPK
jgi:hypothetical protein